MNAISTINSEAKFSPELLMQDLVVRYTRENQERLREERAALRLAAKVAKAQARAQALQAKIKAKSKPMRLTKSRTKNVEPSNLLDSFPRLIKFRQELESLSSAC